jgi:dTDP-4-amino-4,6-dideoxygalactose transaminase
MSEYHAAIGLAELDGWPAKCQAFGRVADAYRRRFAGVGADHHLYCAPQVASCYALLQATDADHAETLHETLYEMGVETRSWYGSGIHGHEHFRCAARAAVPVTSALLPTLIGLPMAPDLSEDDIELIAGAVETGLGIR